MESKICEILCKVLECQKIDINSSQENVSGWDSMKQLSIAFELESEFDLSLDPDEIVQLVSVKKILNIIKNKI